VILFDILWPVDDEYVPVGLHDDVELAQVSVHYTGFDVCLSYV